MAIVESTYVPREHAIAFHARSQRFAVMVMHRRAGKTVMCINDLIDKAIQCKLPMPRYSYVAPLYKQAKDIAWNYLKHYAAPLLAKPPMESELSVTLKNGAVVRLYGADNPDALRGVYHDGVILDEYGDMQPRLFGEVIAPALVDRQGWVVFIGTPKGPNNFFDVWNDAQENPNWFKKMLKASESGIISPEDLEMMRNLPGSDEETFQQEFECDFHAAVRGAYYGKLLNTLEEQGHMGIFLPDQERLVHTAWDIGYSDDTSIWFFQHDGKIFRMVDFFSESGYSVDDVVYMLGERGYTYGQFWLPHDAKNKSFQTGKSTIELLGEQGIKARLVPSLSLQDGIQAVRRTLPQVQFNIANKEVKRGLDALRLYQREWDDRNNMFKANPKHDWSSHPSDAFRMFALAMNPGAAKAASRGLNIGKEQKKSNVMTLDQLHADREADLRRRGDRI